jgi:H+transporting two-sector ATPase B/B' subunit
MLEFNATFIVSMVSFIIFIMIMNTIFYKPIFRVINERQNFIDEHNNDAKNSREQAKDLLIQKENRLNRALSESKKIVSDKVLATNCEAKAITEKAKAETAEKIQTAKENIKVQELNTSGALKNNIKDLAEVISSKILGENVIIENIDNDEINKVL